VVDLAELRSCAHINHMRGATAHVVIMTAFKFVTLVCDRCFASRESSTSFNIADARAEAAEDGWTTPSRGEDRCGNCNGRTLAEALEFGVPIVTTT